MEFVEELKKELNDLKKTRNIIASNPVFINEEINELDNKIRQLENILSVMKE